MVHFFFQNLPKFGSNLRKFWKNFVILLKNWTYWYMNGSRFLDKWYLYGSTFKFCGDASLPKPNLSTPSQVGSQVGNSQENCFLFLI